MKVVWVAALWCVAVHGDTLDAYFSELCPPDHVISNLLALNTLVGHGSASACAFSCLHDATCQAFQVMAGDRAGVYTCQLFSCPKAALCVASGQPSAAYYRASRQSSCPDEFAYDARSSSCHHVVPSATFNAHGAAQACEQLGAHLVAVDSEDEQQALEGLMAPTSEACGAWWTAGETSATDTRDKESWYWHVGCQARPMDYRKWDSGQPNNKQGDEQHLRMRAASEYQWSDISPNPSTPFCALCEIDLSP
jgi:hypothetical protein